MIQKFFHDLKTIDVENNFFGIKNRQQLISWQQKIIKTKRHKKNNSTFNKANLYKNIKKKIKWNLKKKILN